MSEKYVCKQCDGELFVEKLSSSVVNSETGEIEEGFDVQEIRVYCTEDTQHVTGYVVDEDSWSLISTEPE